MRSLRPCVNRVHGLHTLHATFLPSRSLQTLRRFMRYNDWQHDPLSRGSAENQIAARFDLIVSPDSPSAGELHHHFSTYDPRPS